MEASAIATCPQLVPKGERRKAQPFHSCSFSSPSLSPIPNPTNPQTLPLIVLSRAKCTCLAQTKTAQWQPDRTVPSRSTFRCMHAIFFAHWGQCNQELLYLVFFGVNPGAQTTLKGYSSAPGPPGRYCLPPLQRLFPLPLFWHLICPTNFYSLHFNRGLEHPSLTSRGFYSDKRSKPLDVAHSSNMPLLLGIRTANYGSLVPNPHHPPCCALED